LIDCIIVP